MKKFLLTLCVLTLFALPALAEDASLTAAKALVPDGAALIEQDYEHLSASYEFRDGTTFYEVLVDLSTNTPVSLEISYPVRAAASAALDEAAAVEAVAALLPDAQVHYALLEEDDRRYTWQVFAEDGADLVVLELNAETGETIDIDRFYGMAGQVMLPDALVEALTADWGELTLTELEFSIDDEGLFPEYSGKARIGNRLYEFDADGATGRVLEMEHDD